MTRPVAFVAFTTTWMALAAGVCGLNPQPLPPDQAEDSGAAGFLGGDSSVSRADAGSPEAGGSTSFDGSADHTSPVQGNGDGEAGDGGSDASLDGQADGGEDDGGDAHASK
jgi:hypothetical protein